MKQFRSVLSYIFLTDDKSRLRAGWRLLIAVSLTVLSFNIIDWVRHAMSIEGPTTGIVDFFVVTTVLFLTRQFVDKRSIASLGLRMDKQAALDVLAGIGITFVLMLCVYVIEYAFGWLKFESFAWQHEQPWEVVSQTLRHFVGYTRVAWTEELVNRGYVLQTIASGLNLPLAALITSISFGMGHLSNPNSSWMAAAGITFLALFFVYGYARTCQLWLPIGMHLGWNFFQSAVFGFPVSGFDRPGLLHIHVSGPELWTGGAFGPEAGMIMLPISLLAVVLIHLYTKRDRISRSKMGNGPDELNKKRQPTVGSNGCLFTKIERTIIE